MKLSELTYSYLVSLGMPRASMHTDCTDTLRSIINQEQFERAKADLAAVYGDVEVSVNPEAAWFDRIRIEDPKWKKDHKEYCNRKAEWCRRNTSE